jgi:hypothetical protein
MIRYDLTTGLGHVLSIGTYDRKWQGLEEDVPNSPVCYYNASSLERSQTPLL